MLFYLSTGILCLSEDLAKETMGTIFIVVAYDEQITSLY